MQSELNWELVNQNQIKIGTWSRACQSIKLKSKSKACEFKYNQIEIRIKTELRAWKL